MKGEMVLNELSLEREAGSVYDARSRMALLVGTLVAAVRAGAQRTLRTHKPINTILLARDYPVSRWRNDSSVEREGRTYLSSLLSKTPFLSATDSEEVQDRSLSSDFLFEGRRAIGMGVALLLDALSVSLASEPCWEASHLSVSCSWLDSDGELSEEQTQLPHACRPEHIAELADWIAGRDLLVDDGLDLWKRREQLFPALRFCEGVADQIAEIPAGEPLLRQIFKRLMSLDRYFRSWEGVFEPLVLPMKITPESHSAVNRYASEHSFLCPDGVRRLFSWHARLTPGAWRIYFEPDSASGTAFIGYIGKKLPGAFYRT